MISDPRHLYVHIPYCAAKCPYCDFNSIAGREDEYSAYVEALLTEIHRLPSGPYATVFMGGGTPTALPPRLLERVVAGIGEHIQFDADYEWTCEANPGSVDRDRFAVLAANGVNRISLGIQSVHDHHLRFLGRVHDSAQAEAAVDLACDLFPRVSADLIVGLPDQTLAELDVELDLYQRHNLQHASVYHLAIEPGTEFHARHAKGALPMPDQEHAQQVLETVWERLDQLGLAAYETSNFARQGEACRHNLAYWCQADYQAAGAGAVSTVAAQRVTREPHPAKYIAAIMANEDAVWRREPLDHASMLVETWMLGLRLASGVDLRRVQAAGDPSERWRPIADELAQRGLVSVSETSIALTSDGRRLQDAVTVALLPE